MGVRGALLCLAAAPAAQGLAVDASQWPLPFGPPMVPPMGPPMPPMGPPMPPMGPAPVPPVRAMVPPMGPAPMSPMGVRALASGQEPPAGSPDAPIYVEVVGSLSLNGPAVASVEQNFMSTLVPGSGAFKLLDDDLAAHDDLYKSKLLNFLTGDISQFGLSCLANLYCVADWYRQLSEEKAKKLGAMYSDSLDRGCMTIGGCRKATTESFTYHLKRNDNMIFEADEMDYAALQARMAMIQSVGNYRAKTIGLVCTLYSEIEQSNALDVAQKVLSFMQRPKQAPAPVLKSAVNLAMKQRQTLCTFNDVLSCMSRQVDAVRTASGNFSCDPAPDGVYVWANSRQGGPRLVAFAEAGGLETDTNFVKARELIHRAMPPGLPPCTAKKI